MPKVEILWSDTHQRDDVVFKEIPVNTKEAYDILSDLMGVAMSWNTYFSIVENVRRLDALSVNRTLDEALNSGDGTYKP